MFVWVPSCLTLNHMSLVVSKYGKCKKGVWVRRVDRSGCPKKLLHYTTHTFSRLGHPTLWFTSVVFSFLLLLLKLPEYDFRIGLVELPGYVGVIGINLSEWYIFHVMHIDVGIVICSSTCSWALFRVLEGSEVCSKYIHGNCSVPIDNEMCVEWLILWTRCFWCFLYTWRTTLLFCYTESELFGLSVIQTSETNQLFEHQKSNSSTCKPWYLLDHTPSLSEIQFFF